MKLTSGLIRRLGQTWTQVWTKLEDGKSFIEILSQHAKLSEKDTNKTFGIFWHLRSKILLMLESESSVLVKSVMLLHIFGDVREYVLWSPFQKTQLWLFLSSRWHIQRYMDLILRIKPHQGTPQGWLFSWEHSRVISSFWPLLARPEVEETDITKLYSTIRSFVMS